MRNTWCCVLFLVVATGCSSEVDSPEPAETPAAREDEGPTDTSREAMKWTPSNNPTYPCWDGQGSICTCSGSIVDCRDPIVFW